MTITTTKPCALCSREFLSAKWEEACDECREQTYREDEKPMDTAWIETYTGKKFHPMNPKPESICVEDIAHGLANICRYNGQCKHFFSVAQHSLNCADYIRRMGFPNRWQLLALLHDAAEAYISDIPKPIKPLLPRYQDAETRVQMAIYSALGVRPPNSIERGMIKQADLVMLATEARVLMPCDGWGDWLGEIEPDDDTVIAAARIDDVKQEYIGAVRELLGAGDGQAL